MDKPIENTEAKAWIYSLIVYAAFLLILYFVKIVYTQPQEVVTFGVDLNYGVDLIGSGDIQTTNKANDSKNAYDVKPEGSSAKEPKKVESKPIIAKKEIITKPSLPSKILTAEEDTKITVKKTNTESPKQPTSQQTKTTTPVKTTPAEPTRNVDNGSIMKKSSGGAGGSTGSNGTTGTRDGIGGNNNGDGKPGEVGDKGDPRGTPDGKSLYGTPGKGGGSSGSQVSISGWKNKGNLSISKDNSNETGTIVFEVVINDFGDIINIRNRPTSINPSVVKYYENQIKTKLKSTLQPEGTPPSRSSGTITIRITRG